MWVISIRETKTHCKPHSKALVLATKLGRGMQWTETPWRKKIKKGAKMFKEKRMEIDRRKRGDRKHKKTPPDTASTNYACPTCGRKFIARIGLSSHIRAHKRRSK